MERTGEPLGSSQADSPKWYRDGIRFECTRCGNCCRNHGEYAHVFLEHEDSLRIARHLGLTAAEFFATHTERVNGWFVLRSSGDACSFLGASGCTIYPARPKQCRTWPFWPRNLERKIWEGEVKATCPGIGTGKLHSQADIDAQANSMEPGDAPRSAPEGTSG